MKPARTAELETMRHELRAVMALAREVADAAARVLSRLEGIVQDPFETGLEDPGATMPPPGAWVALHRPGRPSKIETDPELRAFVIARLGSMTFPEIAEASRARFGQERGASTSGLHRFWTRNRARLQTERAASIPTESVSE